MLVEIAAVGDYHYPDVSVVCGPAEIRHDQRDILLNPTVVFEVLSPSTEQYDRGKKLHNYLTIPSLQDYLLVAQDTSALNVTSVRIMVNGCIRMLPRWTLWSNWRR